MMVRKPEDGDPETAARIREAATAYTVSARQADYADADDHRKVDDYRKGVEDIETARQEGRPEAEPDTEAEEADQQAEEWTPRAPEGTDAIGEAADEDTEEEAEE